MKNGFRPKVSFETKAPDSFRGTTQIARVTRLFAGSNKPFAVTRRHVRT